MPAATAGDILVVEDEAPIREMLRYTLRRAGYAVREAATASAARECIAQQVPDLLLVDWMLPDISGLELTRILRSVQDTRRIAVIMLTARAEEADRIAGLDGGADDYLTKPFSTRELLARIKTVLRRRAPAQETDEHIEVGGLKLDRDAHRFWAGGRPIPLSPSEYRILEFLICNADRPFTRDQILDHAWQGATESDGRTVDVHIRRLRIVLEEFGVAHMVQTVRGIGYRLSARSD